MHKKEPYILHLANENVEDHFLSAPLNLSSIYTDIM